jgi:NADH-quinone oxidoreductase subunit L
MLLLGACGKSGQFPLHTWLPDAMAGPTPVSALIHAATMVTAGVYLIARSLPLYEVSDTARLVVGIVGAITLVIGAVIGCVYDDIKKVLAYSTVSQIGYMFLAVSIPGAGAVAILHLLTHGFFKANLFLGAGSVMHAMNDDVDMRRYGALAPLMPVTFATFAMGYLAIIGFPGFSGFWSKDAIIETAYGENVLVGTGALLGAGITAFYMTRVMLMTFLGRRRWAAGADPHESPGVMTVPLILLAALSVVGGVLLLGDWVVEWLAPVVGEQEEHQLGVPIWVVTLGTLVVVAAGAALAFLLYGRRPVVATAPAKVSPVTRAARADLYGDAVNEAAFMRPGQYLTRSLVFVDNRGVDGTVNGLSALIGGSSGRLRRLQTGFVRSYALAMLGGALFIVLTLLAMTVA